MSFNKVIWLNHRDLLHPRAGGAERTIYEISRRLVGRGYQVSWLSTKSPGLPSHEKIEGIDIYRLGGNITAHIRDILFENRQSEGTVVVDDLAHVVPWMSERFGKLPGTAFFRHLHQRTLDGQLPGPKGSILKRIEKTYPLLYKKWPFVTESKQGVRDLEELGISPDRIVRIPPGVDLERLQPKEKFTEPSLVYFGGLRDYKRPWEALYLLKELKEDYPDIKLRVSGEGPSLNSMRSLAGKLELGNNVEFMGRLDNEHLFDIVARSWLNLHFSVAEGWGYSILEASACGTPTVAYDVPGVNEAIINGTNGFIVDELEQTELLRTVLDFVDRYEHWPTKCRELSTSYSWDSTTLAWEQHFDGILPQ